MTGPRRVPELFVEQLARGELSPERAKAVHAALEAEPGGLERLAELARSDAEIVRALPPARVAREVERRAGPVARPAPSWRVALPALAVAATAILLIGPLTPAPRDPGATSGDHVRLKGARPALLVYRKTAEGAERLGEQAMVSAGDVLQVAYSAAGLPFGVILSVDGRGEVTLHHPASAEASTELVPGGEVRLPHGYALDDAPTHETFVLIASDHPLDVAALLEVAGRSGADGPFVDTTGAAAAVTRFVANKAVP